MKTATMFVVGAFCSALLTSAFFVGCGGHKEEVKQDSLVCDTVKVDSLGVDTVVVDTNKH